MRYQLVRIIQRALQLSIVLVELRQSARAHPLRLSISDRIVASVRLRWSRSAPLSTERRWTFAERTSLSAESVSVAAERSSTFARKGGAVHDQGLDPRLEVVALVGKRRDRRLPLGSGALDLVCARG